MKIFNVVRRFCYTCGRVTKWVLRISEDEMWEEHECDECHRYERSKVR
jgi:hypothetical protein